MPSHPFCLPSLRRKKTITKERKLRVEEKKRLEEMAARMSAKKLQRLKKVSLKPSLPPFLPLLSRLPSLRLSLPVWARVE